MHWTEKLPKKRIVGGALFHDEDGRVLLVKPTYMPDWDYPGGVVEAEETPYTGTCREIEEELGLTRPVGRLLVVDWEPAHEVVPIEGLCLVFDGGALSADEIATIRIPPAELADFAFCTAEEAETRLPPYLSRRVAAAMRARDDGSTIYLDDGIPVQ